MKLHRLTDEFMRADDDVDLTVSKVFQQSSGLFGTTGPCQVIHPDGHILQSGGESAEMLIGQDGGRYEHSHLFTIRRSLEGSTHGDLRLTETAITTNQTIHGFRLLHIGLYILCGFQLVWRVLIEETGLEFMLQVSIVAEGESLLTTALRIEFNQVAGDILDMFLGTFLETFPLTSAKRRKARSLTTILRPVFRHLI